MMGDFRQVEGPLSSLQQLLSGFLTPKYLGLSIFSLEPNNTLQFSWISTMIVVLRLSSVLFVVVYSKTIVEQDFLGINPYVELSDTEHFSNLMYLQWIHYWGTQWALYLCFGTEMKLLISTTNWLASLENWHPKIVLPRVFWSASGVRSQKNLIPKGNRNWFVCRLQCYN